MCLPCYFNDETDCHTGIFVCTAKCIHNVQFLIGKFFLSEFLDCLPCFLGSGVVIILVFVRCPPYSILGIFINNDEFVFGRTSGVDTCHNVYSTQLADLSLFITFQSGFGLFFE